MPEMTPRPLVALAADADDLRELLAVVLDALTPPHAATMAGAEVRNSLLIQRNVHVAIVLQSVLVPSSAVGVRFHIDYLRGKLAELPAEGYVTAEVARARQEAGENYAQSVREDFPIRYCPTIDPQGEQR
jgi:hypothetical protein